MIQPMLVKICPEDKQESFLDNPSYIGEVKYDGYRCICDNGKFYSRLGNDLSAKVPHLNFLSKYNVILDGELYLPGGTSSDVTCILGSLPERAIELQQQNGWLTYVVFDVLQVVNTRTMELPYEQRREILSRLWDSEIDKEPTDYIEMSLATYDKRQLLKDIETIGGEGIVLKNIHAEYYPNKRPANNWLKIKKHSTMDVVITGFTEGKGKYKELIGAIEFGVYKSDTLVNIGSCSGMTDEVRRDITDNPGKYLGTVMEVGYMQTTSDGHLRHPAMKQVLRTDKLPEQCTWEQMEV